MKKKKQNVKPKPKLRKTTKKNTKILKAKPNTFIFF